MSSASPPPAHAARARRSPARLGVKIIAGSALFCAVVAALSWTATTFLVQTFSIPSRSMEESLTTGDRVVVSKLTPGPFDLRRGDIVVFTDPGGWLPPTSATSQTAEDAHPQHSAATTAVAVAATTTAAAGHGQQSSDQLIKRVIGLPGDQVTCCNASGQLLVNGTVIDEGAYLSPGMEPSRTPFEVRVPPDKLWVMGDNRSNSLDSRYHPQAAHAGFVPLDQVVGRAEAIAWPLSRATWLKTPSTFDAVPEVQKAS